MITHDSNDAQTALAESLNNLAGEKITPELQAAIVRNLSPDTVATYIREYNGEGLPYPVFMEVSKKLPNVTVEMVPFRVGEDGELEVLLTQRPEGDPWAGKWHVPGTVVRGTDTPIRHNHDFSAAIERFFDPEKGELGKLGIKPVEPPVFVRSDLRDTKVRGIEFAAVHYALVDIPGEPPIGKFVKMSELADFAPQMVAYHPPFILDAAKQFRADHPELAA